MTCISPYVLPLQLYLTSGAWWLVFKPVAMPGLLTPFFSGAEISRLRDELLSFLRRAAVPGSLRVEPRQPFLLDCWDGLCRLSQDPDPALPSILQCGVPTGVLEPIAPSGVWEALGEPVEFDTNLSHLSVHTCPRKSGLEDEELTLSLILKDVAEGFAFELPGGEAEAREHRGSVVAAGKLGISQPPGKKPRLIGDGTVSGANAACWISENRRFACLRWKACSASYPIRRGTSVGVPFPATFVGLTNPSECVSPSRAFPALSSKAAGLRTAVATSAAVGRPVGFVGLEVLQFGNFICSCGHATGSSSKYMTALTFSLLKERHSLLVCASCFFAPLGFL